MRRRVVVLWAAAVVSLAGLRNAASQGIDPLGGLNDEQKRSLAAPYAGITTGGPVPAGLFPVRATSVSTAPVRAAAEAFLAGLDAQQRARTLFPVDDREWRIWVNTPGPVRQGVSFEEMSAAQRERAFALLRASLSQRGFEKADNVMKLNETLAELRGADGGERFGQWKYWLTIMGVPSDAEPWGWQLDGHHLAINYFVLGEQVVMTPTFMGSQPVRAEAGKYKGTAVLQDEQDRGLRLFASLDPAQRAVAALRDAKGNAASVAGAYRDNLTLEYAGLKATELDESQRAALLELIAEYVGTVADGHARIKMADIARHFDDTHFAWAGTADPAGVFYYRIQSPVVLIEFDHQSGAGQASRDHIHTVVRTPNGNDYGKDLLRQHYAVHPHAAN